MRLAAANFIKGLPAPPLRVIEANFLLSVMVVAVSCVTARTRIIQAPRQPIFRCS
jgi:hypothetical protein